LEHVKLRYDENDDILNTLHLSRNVKKYIFFERKLPGGGVDQSDKLVFVNKS